MLDESICHSYGCWVYFVAFILFLIENTVTKHRRVGRVDPDQILHYVASDLGLQSLPMTLLRVSR